MKTLNAFAFVAALTLAAPALATTAADVEADAKAVQASEGAVVKDQVAIDKQHATMEHNRALKAKAKAEGDLGTQAAASVKLGANHTVVGAKNVEKSIDEKILEHDKEEMKESATEAAQ